MSIRKNSRGLFGLVLILMPTSWSLACEFCTAPSVTLTEQRDQAAAVLYVKYVANAKPKVQFQPGLTVLIQPARTEYEVVKVLVDRLGRFHQTTHFFVPGSHAAQPKATYLLMPSSFENEWTWKTPLTVTPEGVRYVANLPDLKQPAPERLKYFLNHLESPDVMIANDAYGEFAQAPFSEIRELRESLPRTKVRQWIDDEDTTVTRLGLYGILLGLCGGEDDARSLAQRIQKPTTPDEIRLGIDGIMAGYLLLKGEEGLPLIEERLRKKDSQPNYSEVFAAMKAVEFCWIYEKTFPRDHLKQTQHLLLERPEVADLAIITLSRWKDWTIQDRLMEMYDQKEFDFPSIKRTIIRYFRTCSKDTDPSTGESSQHALSAKQHLDTLYSKDPETVRQVERFFRIE